MLRIQFLLGIADKAVMNTIYANGLQGQVSFDGDWVTITRHGLRARLNHGFAGDKRIPVANITSVQFRGAGLTSGYIQFSILGGLEGRRGLLEAGNDENSLQFSRKNQADFEAIRDAVEGIIVARSRGTAASAGSSLAEELGKLAALRDQGVLSDEEFTIQKQRLLA